MMAGVRTVVESDISFKVAGLETKVGGIEKTVDNLTRSMHEQNSSLRQDMAHQTGSIMSSIDKLTVAAGEGNRNLRAEFTSDLKAVADKQGIKSNTLIALCTLGLGALGFFIAMRDKPTDEKFAKIEAAISRQQTEYVPRPQIEKMQAQIDKHERDIITREEHDRTERLSAQYEAREEKMKERAEAREDKLRDRIYQLESEATKDVKNRALQRMDLEDDRLRAVEQKTAK